MLLYYPQIEDDLTEALQFSYKLQLAGAIPLVETLENRMTYLSMYANHDHIDNTITVLGVDFADYSFSFGRYHKTRDHYPMVNLDDIENMLARRNPNMTIHQFLEAYGYNLRIAGGLIYHGPHKTQDPLSVVISPVSGWSIHT